MYSTSVSIIDGKRDALEKGDEAVVEQVGRGKDIMSILRMSRDLRRLSYINASGSHSQSKHGSVRDRTSPRTRTHWTDVVRGALCNCQLNCSFIDIMPVVLS